MGNCGTKCCSSKCGRKKPITKRKSRSKSKVLERHSAVVTDLEKTKIEIEPLDKAEPIEERELVNNNDISAKKTTKRRSEHRSSRKHRSEDKEKDKLGDKHTGKKN